MYIGDGSDEEQDEELRSNFLLFVFREFISCPTAHKMVLSPSHTSHIHGFYFFFLFFIITVLFFCNNIS